MTNFKYFVAACATATAVAITHSVVAQDDLDDLIKDLESPSAAMPAQQEEDDLLDEQEPAPEEPVAEAPVAAEEPVKEMLHPAASSDEPAVAEDEPAVATEEEPAVAEDEPAADETPKASAEDNDLDSLLEEVAPAAEEPAAEAPAAEEPVKEMRHPAASSDEPVAATEEEPAASSDEPAAATEEEPAASSDEPVADETPKASAEDNDLDSLLEEVAPAAEEPAAEAPAAEEPVKEMRHPAASSDEPAVATEEEPAVAEDEPVADETPKASAEDDDLDSLLKDVDPEVAPTAEEPAAEEPVKEMRHPAASPEEPTAEEPAAEEPAAEEPVKEMRHPAASSEEPAAEEPAAEEPVKEMRHPAASSEEPAAEEPAAEEPVKEMRHPAASSEEPAAEEPAAVKPQAPAASGKYTGPDAELIEQIRAAQVIRSKAFNMQAEREIRAAEQAMENEEYLEAVKHFNAAKNLMSDSPKMAAKKKVCEQGIANGLYMAGLQEYRTGRIERAMKLMEKAMDRRHPKARRQLQTWKTAGDPDANAVDISEIKNVRNDDEYKEKRREINQRLKRSRQFLSARNLKRALDECELVLVMDPQNQEAFRLRRAIEQKRRTIYGQEREAAREGMMADVDAAWRPVYAVDARQVEDVSSDTAKNLLAANDPERAVEQEIIRRMKEMKLPQVEFKPPATIIDAVEWFRQASKDYDRQDLPVEKRGFNMYLKPPETLRTNASENSSEEESSGFGQEDEAEGSNSIVGVPVIPILSCSDLSFYDALKYVCEAVKYKFKVQGSLVVVMHENAAVEEMVTRSYPVLSSFMDRMDTASEDVQTLRSNNFGGGSSGGGEGGENKEKDWKEFFSLLGVQWPEGSSIMYIKTVGKLRVKNTYENLAQLEHALTDMRVDPTLIEIETRFVEVCQEDLNSLGFEWILNSDYSLNLGKHVSRALGLRHGAFGESSGQSTYSRTLSGGSSTTYAGGTGNYGGTSTSTANTTLAPSTATESFSSSSSRTIFNKSSGANWIRSGNAHHNRNIGVSSFGGDSDQGNGMRYMSTLSNHISGEGYSTNDRFMRLNAFLGGADLSMILHMLSQRSDTDLLSAPKVLTKPGEQAKIQVVTEYIYPTDYEVQLQSSSSGSSGSSGGSQSAILAVVEPQSFTMRPVGVILDVTPTLIDDGNLIDLKLTAEVVDEPTWKNYGMRIPFTGNSSSLENFTGIGDILTGLSEVLSVLGTGLDDNQRSNFADSAVGAATTALTSLTTPSNDNITYYDAPMEQPFFHVRSVDSTVTVFPGATLVMGGLITEQRKAMDDKIPFLGDIPFIGRLFRSHSEQTNKRNLLIFVTTRLMDVHGRELAVGSKETKDAAAAVVPVED